MMIILLPILFLILSSCNYDALMVYQPGQCLKIDIPYSSRISNPMYIKIVTIEDNKYIFKFVDNQSLYEMEKIELHRLKPETLNCWDVPSD